MIFLKIDSTLQISNDEINSIYSIYTTLYISDILHYTIYNIYMQNNKFNFLDK